MRQRTTQHKTKRDERERSAENRELKSANRKLEKKVSSLTREVARLRRRLEKNYTEEYVEEEVETLASTEETVLVEIKPENSCPSCASDLTELVLGTKVLCVCKTCRFRTTKSL